MANSQTQIDVIKEQLISNFEIRYLEEFQAPDSFITHTYNQKMQAESDPIISQSSETAIWQTKTKLTLFAIRYH